MALTAVAAVATNRGDDSGTAKGNSWRNNWACRRSGNLRPPNWNGGGCIYRSGLGLEMLVFSDCMDQAVTINFPLPLQFVIPCPICELDCRFFTLNISS